MCISTAYPSRVSNISLNLSNSKIWQMFTDLTVGLNFIDTKRSAYVCQSISFSFLFLIKRVYLSLFTHNELSFIYFFFISLVCKNVYVIKGININWHHTYSAMLFLYVFFVPVESEGEISIQQNFTADLNNKLSPAYQNFTKEFSKAVRTLYYS